MAVWRSRVRGPWVKPRRCACSPARAPTQSPGQRSLMNKEAALCPLVLLPVMLRSTVANSRWPLSKINYLTACRQQMFSLDEKVHEWVCHLAVACSTSCPMHRRFFDLIQQERFAKCVIIRASPCWNASQTTKLSADVKLTGKKNVWNPSLGFKTFQIF